MPSRKTRKKKALKYRKSFLIIEIDPQLLWLRCGERVLACFAGCVLFGLPLLGDRSTGQIWF
ncbi:MAG: hypothetical protein CMJ78_08495 [Planctomycetaceae bacterium]|nr:hypothetical protein [Planctomycetaceae bacterium]